jgi:hypothetical protein
MSARGQIAPVFLVVATLLVLAVGFAINVVGFQSTAGAAMGGALRSAALAGLHQFDPVKSACGRYALRVSATTSTDCEGNTISSSGTTAASVVRDYVSDALVGVGASGDYLGIFSPSGGIATTIADAAGTNGGTEDGLDVEIINPAYSSGQTNERALNGAFDDSVSSCAGAGVYPAGVTSALDGACYTRATIVVRLILTLRQSGSAGDTTITRIFSASAGTDVE